MRTLIFATPSSGSTDFKSNLCKRNEYDLNFGDDFSLYNGFLLSKDKNNVLLFITPAFESNETDKNAGQINIYKYSSNSDLWVRTGCGLTRGSNG